MPNTLKYSVAFVLAASILPRIASAQQAVLPQISPDAGKQKMDIALPGIPLDRMLDDGWFIQSVAGSEGEVLILFKGNGKGHNQFQRCVLTPVEGNSVNKSGRLSAACRSLN